MPALKPEKRLDHNGRLVTRWVKDSHDAKPSMLPAPSAVIAESPRASKSALNDLEEFFRNFQITKKYPHRDTLRCNVPRMSESSADELVHGLWEGFNAFENPEAVAGTLERIYGDDSPIAREHRDTVYRNLFDTVPPYGMNWDSDNQDILKYTWVIFDAVNGEQSTSLFSDEDKLVYQSAACVTNHIFDGGDTAPSDLKSVGFVQLEDGGLMLDGTGAIDALRENLPIIDQIRDNLMHRMSFHPDVIREMAKSGVLSEGTL